MAEESVVACLELMDIERVVRCIYAACDTGNTNSVSVSTLLEFVKPYLKDNLVEFQELSAILDPHKVNPCISLEDFSEALSQWATKVSINSSEEEGTPENSSEISSIGFAHSTPIRGGYYQLLKNCPEILNMSTSLFDRGFGDATTESVDKAPLEEKIKQLQFEVHNTTAELEIVRQQLNVAEEQNERLQSDLNHLSKKFQDAQKATEKLQQCKIENEEIKEEVQSSKIKLCQLKKELDNTCKDYQRLKSEIVVLENKKLTLENRIEALQKKEQIAQEQFRRMRAELAEKDYEISYVESIVRDLKAELDVKNECITYLTKELEISKRTNQDNETSLCFDLSYKSDSVLNETKKTEPDDSALPEDSETASTSAVIEQQSTRSPVPHLDIRKMSLLKYVLLKNSTISRASQLSQRHILDESLPSDLQGISKPLSPIHVGIVGNEENNIETKLSNRKENPLPVALTRTYQGDKGEELYCKDLVKTQLRSPHKSLRDELAEAGVKLKTQDKLVDLKEEIRCMKVDMKEQEIINAGLFTEVDNLSCILTEREHTIQVIQCELDNTKTKYVEVKNEYNKTKKEFDEIKNEQDVTIKDLRQKCDEIERKLEEQKSKYDNSRNESDKKVSDLRKELDKEKELNSELQGKINLEKEKYDFATDKLKLVVSQYKSKLAKLLKEKDETIIECGRLESKVNTLEEEVQKLVQQNESRMYQTKNMLSILFGKITTCLNLFTLYNAKFGTGDSDFDLAEAKTALDLIITKLEKCCCGGKSDGEIGKKVGNYEKSQLKIERLNEKIETLSRELQRERMSLKEMNNEMKTVQKELNAKSDRVRILNEALLITRQTNISLQNEKHQLFGDNLQLNMKLEKATDTIQYEKNRTFLLQDRLNQLTYKLEALERKFQEQGENLKEKQVDFEMLQKKKDSEVQELYEQLEMTQKFVNEIHAYTEKQSDTLKRKMSEIISNFSLQDDIRENVQETESEDFSPNLEIGLVKLANQINLVPVLLDLLIKKCVEGKKEITVLERSNSYFESFHIDTEFSDSLERFLKLEELLSESPPNQTAFPQENDEFLEDLKLDGDMSRFLTKEEMKEKFTTLALAYQIDLTTSKKRYQKQETRYKNQIQNYVKCIEYVVGVLKKVQNLQCTDINSALSGLESMRKLSHEIFLTAELFGSLKYEKRSLKCWNLAINYVAVLSQESERKITKKVTKIGWWVLGCLAGLTILAMAFFSYIQLECQKVLGARRICPLNYLIESIFIDTPSEELPPI